MCRLAITILDVLDYNKDKNYNENKYFYDFLYDLTKDINDQSLFEQEDDFYMYINIAKYANNSLPIFVIQNELFNKYRVKKNKFPKKSYYSL